MTNLTSIFEQADGALDAAEQTREIAGRRATIRLFVRGATRPMVETVLSEDNSAQWRVAALGLGLGIVGAILFRLLGASWTLGAIGLVSGALTGVMLGVWLTGEAYLAIGPGAPEWQRCEQVVASGRAVLVISIMTERVLDVRKALEAAGGRSFEGRLSEVLLGELQPT